MVVNYFTYVKLVFRQSLILFPVLWMLNVSAQIEDPIGKDSLALPSLSFRVDTLSAVKCTIGSDDAAFFVTDKKERSWEIVAPPQFGMDGLTIKASPMSDLQVDSSFGRTITGLKFEPSGIIFNEPIKINLKMDDNFTDSSIVFFLTDDDGNLTEIPIQRREGNDYTLEINHFSGLVCLVPMSIENICVISKFSTSVHIANAKKLYTANPRIAVVPVSIESRCDKEDSPRLLSLNVSQMLEPEGPAIGNILSSQRGAALSCSVSDIMELQITEEVYKLSDQLVKKALNAIAEYQDQPEKFMAIGKFAITVGKFNSLIGSPNSQENNKLIFNALNKWAKNNIKHYKKKIAEEHDLQYIKTLWYLYKNLLTVEWDEFSSLDPIKEIEKLLRFEMEIEARVYRDCPGRTGSKEYTITKGTVELASSLDYGEGSDKYPQTLIGTGKFSTEGKSISYGEDETLVSTVIPDVFEKEYTVRLNFCELRGETSCMSPGNRKERWEGNEFLNSSLQMIRFTNTYFNLQNRYHKNQGHFQFKITNRQQVLVDDVTPVIQSYDNGEQKVKTEFYYKLIHKPSY